VSADGTWPPDQRIAALAAENARLKRLLCDLTPGGSEFVNSPENCAAWVQRRVQSLSKLVVTHSKRRHDAEAEVARLRSALTAACVEENRRWCYRYNRGALIPIPDDVTYLVVRALRHPEWPLDPAAEDEARLRQEDCSQPGT
jgi:hypothetical protein